MIGSWLPLVIFKQRYKEYLFKKEGFKTRRMVEHLEKDIKHLKIQMASVNLELFNRASDEHGFNK